MRVTTEGLEELNSYEPEPYFNENVGAWDDGLGHFSYDDGATWGDARSYAAAPAPVSTAGAMESLGNTYSLNGPAFDDFNIGNMGQRYDDGLGHYTLDGGASWLNSDGTPYVDAAAQQWQAGLEYQPQYEMPDGGVYEEPGSGNRWYNGLWYDPSGNIWDDKFSQWMTPDQYQQAWQAIMEHDNAAPYDPGPAFTSDPSGNPWGANRETVAPEPGATSFWGNQETFALPGWEGGQSVPTGWIPDAEQEPYEIQWGNKVFGAPVEGEGMGDILGYLGNQFFDPIAETGAQLTPAALEIGRVMPGIGQGLNLGLMGLEAATGYDTRDNAEAGLRDLGSSIAESGGNPGEFLSLQNEKYDERPLWQQIAAGTVYDPTNYVGLGLLKKAGVLDDAAQWADDAIRGVRGLGSADEVIPSIYKASPFRVGDEAQFPAFAKDLMVPPGRAIPQVAGAADDALPPIDFTGAKPKRIATFDWDFPSGLKNGDVVDTPYGKLDVRSVRMGDEGIGTVYGKFVQTNSKLGVSKTDEVMIRNRAPDPAALAANRAKAEAWNAAMKTPDGPALGNAGWKPIVEGGDVKAWDFNGVQIARQADGEWAITVDGATFRASSPKAALDKELAAQAERMASNQAKGLPRYSGKLVNPDDALPPKPPTAAADTALNEPRRKLLDALDEQRRFRESGQADEIIHAGRVQQAKGIAAATENLGDTFAESLDAMSAGARVGKMLPAGQPLDIDDGTALSLLKEAIEFNGGKQFDNYRAGKALNKLLKGEKLQPGEIKMLGQIYGDEVARAIRETNAGRIATVAELTPDDIVKINEQARVDGKRAAVLEAQARRQHELADDLQRQARMDPTNKRLAKAVDDARARAIAKENEADRVLAERANALAAKQNKTVLKAEQSAARAENKAAVAAQLREDKAAMTAANKARLTASDEQSVNFAKNVVARMDASDDLKSAMVDSIDLAVERNRQVLDGFGEDGPGIVRTLYAVATGEVTDSYTAALLMQEANLRSALEMQGMTPQMARGAAKLVREAEIKRRFGAEVPEWVTRSLDQAKPASYQSVRDDPVAALASLSQTIKNTQFGIGDLAVFGQQVLKAGTTNSAAILSGIVNRTLGVVGVKPLGDITEGLGKRVAYQLDGVVQGARGASVDLSQQKTLFSALGKPGRIFDEKALVPATRKLTDFQFGTVLGGLRNLIYEGNLLMAKTAGADITDAAVRRNAAAFANAATGAGQLAQRTSRANVEKAFALSASMRRAQAQQMGQVARLLSPTASRETRVLAAATIVSAGAATYAVGKWINDWIGVEPFEFDPSKPGFGNITLADGTVVNLFPQEQLPKAMARSIGILAREGFGEEQAKDIAKEWGKLLISSQSPAMRPILGSIGVGYDPGRGYAWGDLGKGKDWKERTLDMAPLPPITTQIAREGVGKVLTTANVLGVNAYTESQYDKIDRQVKNDPAYGGRGYSDLSPIEKQAAQEKYGKLEPFGPEGERAAEVLAKKIEQQTASDTMRSQGILDPEQWRRDYQKRKDELRITNDEIYAELRDSGKIETKDPILKPYYAAMAAAEGPDGNLDWDKVDAYRATLTPAESEYISKNTGLIKIDTPAVREFEAVRDTIEASGYFDRSDENWKNVAYYVPTWDGNLGKPVNPGDYASYEEWRNAALQAGLDLVGATREDIGTVTQINAWLDKQEPAKGMEWYGKEWKDEWVQANPRAAYDAWRYGYYNPRKEIKEWLTEQYE